MAIKTYVSVNGQRKQLKKWYASIGGTRKELKKVYASVNGIAKQIFPDRESPIYGIMFSHRPVGDSTWQSNDYPSEAELKNAILQATGAYTTNGTNWEFKLESGNSSPGFSVNLSESFIGSITLKSGNVKLTNFFPTTDSSLMFTQCENLTTIGTSSWDVSNVTDMFGMFGQCTSLTAISAASWDVSNVTNMASMFTSCTNLAQIDVSNWDVSNVTDFSGMFTRCTNLTVLDVSNWDTSNSTTIESMFIECPVQNLDVSHWDTSKMTQIQATFQNCTFNSINVSNWDTSNVVNAFGMFFSCRNLRDIDTSNWDVSNVTNVSQMFLNCNNLTNASVLNIVNMLCNINISKIPAAQRNLMNNNTRSPFSRTKFNNSYYTSMIPALQAAGWTC